MPQGKNEVAYLLNEKKWEAFMKISRFFNEYIVVQGGSISDIKTPPDVVDAVFTVETMTFDFSGDLLRTFVEVSSGVDDISFEIVDENTVRATIRVRNMWEAVRTGE